MLSRTQNLNDRQGLIKSFAGNTQVNVSELADLACLISSSGRLEPNKWRDEKKSVLILMAKNFIQFTLWTRQMDSDLSECENYIGSP